MCRCLLIGGSGFLGSHIAEAFVAEGWPVRILSRTDRYADNLQGIIERVDWRIGALGDRNIVRDAIKNIDVVVHLASATVPHTSADDLSSEIDLNLKPSLIVFEELVRSRGARLILVSSGGTIYGNALRTPQPESDPTNPLCPYGINKLVLEQYLYMLSSRGLLDSTVLRVGNAYGERQLGISGQGAIAVFMSKILDGQPIHLWGDAVRDYIHAEDVAQCCVSMLKNHPVTRRVFNVGTGKGTSLSEIVALLERVTGKHAISTAEAARPFDVTHNVLDISAAKNDFRWEPRINLEDGLARTWQWRKTRRVAAHR